MPDYVVRRATEMLNRERKALNGSGILLLGMADKNSGDARESSSVRVAQLLARLGVDVRFVDDHVGLEVVRLHEPLPAMQVRLSREELEAADLVVLLVDHDEFTPVLLRGVRVLDTRRCLPAADTIERL